MITYLQKFNNLDKELRSQISSKENMEVIRNLEQKYKANLASVVMRVMVREISVHDLVKFFNFEMGMDYEKAKELSEELKKKVFGNFREHLGLRMKDDDPVEKWMEYRHEKTMAGKSGFFYSSEDEEEVEKINEDILEIESSQKTNQMVEIKIHEIISELKINFSSQELKKRFTQIIRTYLLGIRNRINTKQTMMKRVEAGGLSLEEATTDRIMAVVDRIKSQKTEESPEPEMRTDAENDYFGITGKKEAGSQSPADGKYPAARDFEYDFANLQEKEKQEQPDPKPAAVAAEPQKEALPEQAITQNNPTLDLKNALDQFSQTQSPQSPAASKEKEEMVLDLKGGQKEETKEENPEKQEKKPETEPVKIKEKDAGPEKRPLEKMGISFRQLNQEDAAGKVKMVDVKRVPKLTGPLDELREMDLVNLRRISRDPQDMTVKIMEKIKNLEEEAYSQKLEGIKAWRQSPANKLYLELGRESISKNLSVDDIIKERRAQGKEYMSPDEFSAIMDLNKKLRF